MVMMKFMMNKKVYIYFLIGDNDIRYVGKTNNVVNDPSTPKAMEWASTHHAQAAASR